MKLLLSYVLPLIGMFLIGYEGLSFGVAIAVLLIATGSGLFVEVRAERKAQ